MNRFLGQQVDFPLDNFLDDQIELDEADPVVAEFEFDEDGNDIVEEELIVPELIPHDENLAGFFTKGELDRIASDLYDLYEEDNRSREEWLRTYTEGITFLGFSMEEIDGLTKPFEGASDVFHPVLAEAVVRFQSNAITEIFPASGPVLVNVIGEETPDKRHQAVRVREEYNYQLTDNMTEYRNEMEQLLFRLPLAGSVFKKVYYDEENSRPCSMMVTAEDLVMDYQCSDPERGERLCHVMRKSDNEVRKMMRSGNYMEVELQEAVDHVAEGKEREEEIIGVEPSPNLGNQFRTLLEFHINFNLPAPFDDDYGVADPYIITIDQTTRKVLSIYRNWEEGDEKKRREQYFVHYQYIPGLGAYGFGLIHLLGSITRASTSILRQLIDAGVLSNLPGGFKAKGLRTPHEGPIQPGEFVDVESSGLSLKENIVPLPYKEPSMVLAELLGSLVDEARRMGSVADTDIGTGAQNAPVGTTLALLERSLKVMTAVHARLHASLRRELRLIGKIIAEEMPPEYDWDLEQRFNRNEDFDGRVDVIPVSDPNAATQAQRIIQSQAIHAMADTHPEIYDVKNLHRETIRSIGYKNVDKIIPPDEDPPYLDPVQENMRIIQLQPVKAYQEQDHEAHLQTHMAAMTDPQISAMVGQSPNATVMQSQMEAHLAEHLSYKYRSEIERELGVQLPPLGESIPPELEARLSRLVAAAAEQLKQVHVQEEAEKQAEEMAQDPMWQYRLKELELKEMEVRAKIDGDMDKRAIDLAKAISKEVIDIQRIESEEMRAGMKVGADLHTFGQELDHKERLEGVKMGLEAGRNIQKEGLDREEMQKDRELREKEINARKGNSNNSG